MELDKKELAAAVKEAMLTPAPVQIAAAAVMVVMGLGTVVVNGLTLYQGFKSKMGN